MVQMLRSVCCARTPGRRLRNRTRLEALFNIRFNRGRRHMIWHIITVNWHMPKTFKEG